MNCDKDQIVCTSSDWCTEGEMSRKCMCTEGANEERSSIGSASITGGQVYLKEKCRRRKAIVIYETSIESHYKGKVE